jgi:predicted AlkP superfamily phosphohydrolase/phosphomutase
LLALIQFDSVSVPLLERLLDEGRLPALAELRSRGRWHALEAPDADLAAGVYHSLYSGVETGDHGLYHTFQWRAEEQRVRFMGSLPKPETIWERVTRAGGRSLIVDPYVSWPPRAMNGACISGWQFSNRIILQRWASPPGELRRLSRRFGRPPLVEEALGAPTPRRLRRLARRLLAAPERAADAAAEALGRDRFDLLWVTFAPAHFAGHWLWDPAGRLLPDVYAATDRAIGRVVAALPPGTDIIVMSPTGIGPNTSKSDLLPGMLQAVLDGPSGAGASRGSALWRMRGALPTPVRSAFTRVMPGAVNRDLVARLYLRGTDWSRTRAFAVPGETHGLVRLNLRDREREGIVEPGKAYEVLEEIDAGLRTFRDAEGEPAVAATERPPARWPDGARAGELPDLLVRWSERPSSEVRALTSERFGTVHRPGVGTGWPGNHRDEAWALVVPQASRPRETARPPRVVDLAATAAAATAADRSGLTGEPLLDAG